MYFIVLLLANNILDWFIMTFIEPLFMCVKMHLIWQLYFKVNILITNKWTFIAIVINYNVNLINLLMRYYELVHDNFLVFVEVVKMFVF